MKQLITPEQLHELTDEQKERLRDWWKPSRGDFALAWNIDRNDKPWDHKDIVIGNSTSWGKAENQYFTYDAPETFDNDGSCDYFRKECMFPLLSIGQMMQIIEPHIDNIRIDDDGYHILLYSAFIHDRDLCNCLWHAVKQTL